MELSGVLFPAEWLWASWLLYGLILLWSLARSQVGLLLENRLVNLFFAICVVLMVLWMVRTPIQPGFYWHLSGMVSVTLMFGLPLAILAGSIALAGLTLVGMNDWSGLAPSALLQVVLPASLAQLLLLLARTWLPKHFMIYVFVNAFFAGGLIAPLTAVAVAATLWGVGAYPGARLWDAYLVLLPLMFFPEGMLNGLWMVSTVSYKPHWVRSFRDEEYLHGK